MRAGTAPHRILLHSTAQAQCHHTEYLTTATPGQPRGNNNEVEIEKPVLCFQQKNILSVSYLHISDLDIILGALVRRVSR